MANMRILFVVRKSGKSESPKEAADEICSFYVIIAPLQLLFFSFLTFRTFGLPDFRTNFTP